MKKILVSLIVVVLLGAGLFYFTRADKKIVLPLAENLSKIEIRDEDDRMVRAFEDKKDMEMVLENLFEKSKFTRKESVNDSPVGVKNYYKIEFIFRDKGSNSSRAYIYSKRRGVYIEQPYTGIWSLERDYFESLVGER